ncbi:MAG: hypothetical protein NTW21_42525 [Verrucomicrobia bacterium]|nr:hypothetical protein [Verrucomicrobiota bacterium]
MSTKGEEMNTLLVGLLLALNVNAEPLKTIDGFETPGAGWGGAPHGLAWDGSSLWLSDTLQGKVFQLDTNGTVLSSYNFGPLLGLAWDGTHLWGVSNSPYPRGTVYEIGATGQVFSSFSPPGDYPSGLAWDGECLWITIGGSFMGTTGKLYRVTKAGVVVSSFAIPNDVLIPRDVEYDGMNLWLLDQGSGSGLKRLWHFTTAGSLIGSYHVDSFISPYPTYHNHSPYGIAYDGRHLWISGETTNLRGVLSDAVFKVLPVPEITNISMQDAKPVLELRYVVPFHSCTVQRVPNLGLQWTNIWSWTSDGFSRTWQDDSATNLPTCFYRFAAE